MLIKIDSDVSEADDEKSVKEQEDEEDLMGNSLYRNHNTRLLLMWSPRQYLQFVNRKGIP